VEDLRVATSLFNLAMLLQAKDDLAGALPLLQRALTIREKLLGPEHPDTVSVFHTLAVLLTRHGDVREAREVLERALGCLEKTLGPEHPETNRMRCNLSCVLLLDGAPAEALKLAETALAEHDKVLGPDHASTQDSAFVTADALDALGRTEEAKGLRERYGVTSADEPKSS